MKNVIKDASILGLLAQNDKTFYIPVYQRNYSWRKEQIDILFEDVLAQISPERTGHFFGSLYYFVESSGVFGNQNLVLIDGQQRLTTIMLFLIALRDLSNDEVFKGNVSRKYLLNDNISSQNKIKLKQAALDNIEYENLIRGEDARNTNHKIFSNYKIIRQHISRYINEEHPNNPQSGLEKILEGLNKLYLVLMELDNESPAENPQIVFENINSIGLELTVNDLIRNYLLMGLDKHTQENLYQKYWVAIERNIGDVDKNTPLFVRQFLHMKQMQSIKQDNKEIYRAYKRYFEGEKITNEEALIELFKYSKFYAQIVDIAHHDNSAVADSLYEISTILKRTVSYCFILKLLDHNAEGVLTDEKLNNLLEIVISYLTRRTILNLGGIGSMDEFFIGLTRFFAENDNYDNIVHLTYNYLSRSYASRRFPSDNELKDELKKRDFYSLALKHYILEKISNVITGGNAPINLRDHGDIQYEHIMPLSLTREQGGGYISGDTWDLHFNVRVNTLSNATLTDINQELGNLPFEEKKKKLENESNLLISRKWITDNVAWTIEAMDARFEKLFSHLIKAFPYPQEYQKNTSFNRQNIEYRLDEFLSNELDIADYRLTGMIFAGEEFAYNNNATKMYVDFLNTLSLMRDVDIKSLCDNSKFTRSTREGKQFFSFSVNRESVYKGETVSAKELENGMVVDTTYTKLDLLRKMREVLEYLNCEEEVLLRLQG